MKRFLLSCAALLGACAALAAETDQTASRLILACRENNDLYRVLTENGVAHSRFDTPDKAVKAAASGAGVLLLADDYPEKTNLVGPDVWEEAKRKKLRLYVEYPATLPGMEVGGPRKDHVLRGVVATDFFGSELAPMRIVSINGLTFVPVKAEKASLVAARVAGFDKAVFGLPPETHPILFEAADGGLLVATTKLSHFVTGRYAPTQDWQTIWKGVLGWLQPERTAATLVWTPSVRPSYAREAALPGNAERVAFERGVEWFIKSRLLLHPSMVPAVDGAALGNGMMPTPPPDAPVGDGTLGILEAPLSVIQHDGSQLIGVARRGDCTGESAMALAMGGKLKKAAEYSEIAKNLLDFYLFTSDARKRERGDPGHGAYGLVAWGITTPAWYCANYGDDNARLLLGTAAAAALLGENRWDEAMMMCLLANLRTTGRKGFRSDRIDIGPLSAQGWEPFFRRSIVSFSPHMEAYLWACYLWAYERTGYDLFLDRAKTAIRMTMENYTDGWRWTNGLAQERARIILPLAWLVRVEDTPEHRAWLRKAMDGLLSLQEPCGAIREELGLPGKGMFPPPGSNAAYGHGEASLIQHNGDPVSDLLYTVNFALLGIHEAAAATGEKEYIEAERKLVEFLCRIQVRSERHPALDGGWFRAFDFQRWEAWASNADAGWGAWAIESGWTQGWIVSVLGMRQLDVSLWDLITKADISGDFERLRREMLPDRVIDSLSPVKIQHEAVGKTAGLAVMPSASYPGNGHESLADGLCGLEDHTDGGWLGFHGKDLDATIDLGASVAIRELALGSLQSTGVGIYLPSRVRFEVSEDGKIFRHVAEVLASLKTTEAGPARVNLTAGDLNVRARYVRVHAANLGQIPEGHRAAGQPAWLFVDEVIVNPVGKQGE